MKKIIIIGAGFGGIYTYKYLAKLLDHKDIEITIFNKENYFLFTPMIHEVATGGLAPEYVIIPLRDLTTFPNTKVLIREIVSISLENKYVETQDHKYDYDILIVATGAQSFFYGIEGAQDHALPLKTLKDAIRIKNKLIDAFEKASLTADTTLRTELLTFVIVGAGPTGVELTAEIVEFIHKNLLPNSNGIHKKDISIVLLDRTDKIIPYFSDISQTRARQFLETAGVKILLNNSVAAITPHDVKLADGTLLNTRNVFWTAGVCATAPKFLQNIELDKTGRIIVDEFGRLKNNNDVFVLGDTSSGYPMLAYTATDQAKNIATNIKATIVNKPLNKFTFTPTVKLMSLGQRSGIGEFYGYSFMGKHIWFVWRTVYLSKILSKRKQLEIALNWTLNLFTKRDTSKI